jgi:cell division protein ZapA (FtsZ GTPase activity inhibitor)
MVEGQQRAEVEIFGKAYTLVSDRSVEYALEIAKEVDRRMVSIAAEKNLADITKIAMMTAMGIADELMRTRQECQGRLAATEQARQKLKTIVREVGG